VCDSSDAHVAYRVWRRLALFFRLAQFAEGGTIRRLDMRLPDALSPHSARPETHDGRGPVESRPGMPRWLFESRRYDTRRCRYPGSLRYRRGHAAAPPATRTPRSSPISGTRSRSKSRGFVVPQRLPHKPKDSYGMGKVNARSGLNVAEPPSP